MNVLVSVSSELRAYVWVVFAVVADTSLFSCDEGLCDSSRHIAVCGSIPVSGTTTRKELLAGIDPRRSVILVGDAMDNAVIHAGRTD
jgi:hypothetical protein